MKRSDLLLSIIAAANGESLTPVQLQKIAFLLGQEFTEQLPDGYYDFVKYDYGPFSVEVYRDAEELEHLRLIHISVNSRGGWKEYAATPQGMQKQPSDIPEAISEYITNTVNWARQLSFQQLVREVYRRYPEYRKNSVFQD